MEVLVTSDLGPWTGSDTDILLLLNAQVSPKEREAIANEFRELLGQTIPKSTIEHGQYGEGSHVDQFTLKVGPVFKRRVELIIKDSQAEAIDWTLNQFLKYATTPLAKWSDPGRDSLQDLVAAEYWIGDNDVYSQMLQDFRNIGGRQQTHRVLLPKGELLEARNRFLEKWENRREVLRERVRNPEQNSWRVAYRLAEPANGPAEQPTGAEAQSQGIATQPSAGSQGSQGGLIGKYFPLTEPTFDAAAGVVRFRGRNIETGEVVDIAIQATLVDRSDLDHHFPVKGSNEMFNVVLDWIQDSPDFTGNIVILEDNPYGIHGIGSKELIAVDRLFQNDSMAWWHEAGEAMGAYGQLAAEDIAAALKDRSWYDAKMADPSRKDLALHYALRALQREVNPAGDRDLTMTIKGRLTPNEVRAIIRKYNVRNIGLARQEFRRLRDQVRQMQNRSDEEAVLNELSKQQFLKEEEQERIRKNEEAELLALAQEEQRQRKAVDAPIEALQVSDKEKADQAESISTAERSLKELPASLVSEAFVKKILDNTNRSEWKRENNNRAKRLIDAVYRHDPAVANRVLTELVRKLFRDAHSFSTQAIVLRDILYLVSGFSDGVLFERSLLDSLTERLSDVFHGRPSVGAHDVQWIPNYANFFDQADNARGHFYFKPDFERRVSNLRDVKLRKRLMSTYKEAMLQRELLVPEKTSFDGFAGLVAKLLQKDKHGVLYDHLLASAADEGADPQFRLAVFRALVRNGVPDELGAERSARLTNSLTAFFHTSQGSPIQSDITNLLGNWANVAPLPLKAIVADAVLNSMDEFNMQLKKTEDVRRSAAREYELEKEKTGDGPALEKLRQQRTSARVAYTGLMTQFEERLAILQGVARAAGDAKDNGIPLQERILKFLTEVAKSDNWSTDAQAEAISVLSPYIERAHPAVLSYFNSQIAAKHLDLPSEYSRTLEGNNPGDAIDQLRKLTNPSHQRAGLLLLRRYSGDKDFLRAVIRDASIGGAYRIYAFNAFLASTMGKQRETGDGKIVTEYDEEEFASLREPLRQVADEFIVSKRHASQGSFNELFADPFLQDEEMRVYAMAVLLSAENHPLAQANTLAFVETAKQILGGVVRNYYNNANSKFVIGGEWFRDKPVELFLLVLAHEIKHNLLQLQTNYHSTPTRAAPYTK